MNKLAEMDEIDYKKTIKDGILYLRLLRPPNFENISQLAGEISQKVDNYAIFHLLGFASIFGIS